MNPFAPNIESKPTSQARRAATGGYLEILACIMMLVFVALSAAKGADSDEAQTRRDFEKMATEMPYLAIESVLFDRRDHFFKVADPQDRDTHFRILKQATETKYSKEELLKLLNHSDAKVRTLAMVALFDRNDPTVLPVLVELSNDEAATFDGHGKLSEGWLKYTGIGPPQKSQTVGYIAKKMVAFYMERAGYYYGIKHPTEAGFEKYWNDRKNRTFCASWFAVQLARASQSTSIRELRQKIDALPPDDSPWVLLWLYKEDMGGAELVTEQELVLACQRVGPDKLIQLLQNKNPSNDPDLNPRFNNNWHFTCMMDFVLTHAVQLLRREDSEKLLECEAYQRDYYKNGLGDPNLTPMWKIAAAQLKSSKPNKLNK